MPNYLPCLQCILLLYDITTSNFVSRVSIAYNTCVEIWCNHAKSHKASSINLVDNIFQVTHADPQKYPEDSIEVYF